VAISAAARALAGDVEEWPGRLPGWNLGRTQALRGNIDAQFVRPLLVGETVLLFRLRAPQLAVIIYDGTRLVEGDPALDAYPGLASWRRAAETLWEAPRGGTFSSDVPHGSSPRTGKLSLRP